MSTSNGQKPNQKKSANKTNPSASSPSWPWLSSSSKSVDSASNHGGLSIVRSISIDSQSTTSTKELQASLAATIYAEIQASRDEEEENNAIIPPLLPATSGEEEEEKEEEEDLISPIDMQEWCTNDSNQGQLLYVQPVATTQKKKRATLLY